MLEFSLCTRMSTSVIPAYPLPTAIVERDRVQSTGPDERLLSVRGDCGAALLEQRMQHRAVAACFLLAIAAHRKCCVMRQRREHIQQRAFVGALHLRAITPHERAPG